MWLVCTGGHKEHPMMSDPQEHDWLRRWLPQPPDGGWASSDKLLYGIWRGLLIALAAAALIYLICYLVGIAVHHTRATAPRAAAHFAERNEGVHSMKWIMFLAAVHVSGYSFDEMDLDHGWFSTKAACLQAVKDEAPAIDRGVARIVGEAYTKLPVAARVPARLGCRLANVEDTY
jgi:hypothetical protein